MNPDLLIVFGVLAALVIYLIVSHKIDLAHLRSEFAAAHDKLNQIIHRNTSNDAAPVLPTAPPPPTIVVVPAQPPAPPAPPIEPVPVPPAPPAIPTPTPVPTPPAPAAIDPNDRSDEAYKALLSGFGPFPAWVTERYAKEHPQAAPAPAAPVADPGGLTPEQRAQYPTLIDAFGPLSGSPGWVLTEWRRLHGDA